MEVPGFAKCHPDHVQGARSSKEGVPGGVAHFSQRFSMPPALPIFHVSNWTPQASNSTAPQNVPHGKNPLCAIKVVFRRQLIIHCIC